MSEVIECWAIVNGDLRCALCWTLPEARVMRPRFGPGANVVHLVDGIALEHAEQALRVLRVTVQMACDGSSEDDPGRLVSSRINQLLSERDTAEKMCIELAPNWMLTVQQRLDIEAMRERQERK